MSKTKSGGWKVSLAAVLKQHNATKGDAGHKTVASAATQDKRIDVLYRAFSDLQSLGYKLDSVEQFKGRHMQALVKAWESRELSPSSIQNNISIMRTFAGWIGKDGMVLGSATYVATKGAASRSSIATVDKSWSACGVDVSAKIAQVKAIDERVALQMELQRAFGLRVRESWQLKPHIADQGLYLMVNAGTKGGRDRVVPIETAQQRALIERAKTFAAHKNASTSAQKLSLAQVKNRYGAVCKEAGITKAHGITSHGLRHEYANERYKAISGQDSPVRGGERAVSRDDDRMARLIVAEELGHSREDVTTHYLGR
jgi:site-specific recombinase XerD